MIFVTNIRFHYDTSNGNISTVEMKNMKTIRKAKECAMTILTKTCAHHRENCNRRSLLADLLSLYRQRRALERLDGDALRDIGLSRDQANREAHRPVWDLSGAVRRRGC